MVGGGGHKYPPLSFRLENPSTGAPLVRGGGIPLVYCGYVSIQVLVFFVRPPLTVGRVSRVLLLVPLFGLPQGKLVRNQEGCMDWLKT